jgi:hypothetical protein
MTTSFLQSVTPPALVVDGVRSTSRLGNIARGAVALALLHQGRQVLLPLNDDQRYDLVIEDANRFLRVQCKFGRFVKGVVSFRTASNNVSSGFRDYRGDADYFGVYCGELGTCYLIPVDDAPLRACHLRVTPSLNKQSRRIRWAEDYLIRWAGVSVGPQNPRLVEPRGFEPLPF